MHLGFRERLLVGVTTIVVAFVAAAVLLLTQLTGRSAAEQVTREIDEARASFSTQMQQRRTALQDETRFLARSARLLATAGIPNVDQATFEDTFDEIQAAFAAPLLAFVDTQGHLVASRGRGFLPQQDLSKRIGMGKALEGESGDHVWDLGTRLALVALAPIVQGDELLGVLVRGRPIDASFAEEIGSIGGRDALIAQDGTVLAESWRRQAPEHWAPEPLLALRHATLSDLGANVTLAIDGRPRSGLAVRIHPDAGIVFLSHDLGAILAIRDEARQWLLGIGALLVLLGIGFAVQTARRLAGPLRALTAASDRIGSGDLSARVEVTMHDEIGRLGHSFNAMAQTMQTLVADVTDKAARAEAANRAKDGFLTSMSHELRTPLTGIQSTAELLQQFGEESSPEERAEFLTTIVREAERLGQRISDALEFASFSGNKAKWTLGRVDLLRVCEQACRRIDGLQELKAVAFAIVCEEGAILQGDREHITQALCHLAQNAWTWSPPTEAVEIQVRRLDAGFVIEVSDRGPGIPAHEREKIFDYFTQGGDVLVDKPQGIGIGLKIANEVATAHGGCVDYSERAGGGSVFRMLLRCEDRPIDRMAVPEAASVVHPTNEVAAT